MTIPQEIKNILEKLQKNGFEAYAVGGCVRDLLLGKKPKDWDVCTNALPEQIQKIFPDSFYENKFGTVGVKIESLEENLKIVEVTTYRVDASYSDKRHPDSVSFTRNLQEDLARRDFTINAMALGLGGEIVDLFGGQEDLKEGIIRAVGNPEERFKEDALRILRAVRLSVEIGFNEAKKNVKQVSQSVKQGFTIEKKTAEAIKKNAKLLQMIAKERIKDELEKIIMSDKPDEGILMLHDLGLLEFIIPELEKGIGVAQNRHHIYSIFEHGIFSLKFAVHPPKFSEGKLGRARKNNLVVRLAALLHDIAKPKTKRGEGPNSTFYNHDIIGAKITARILERLRFDKEIIERVVNLVRHHMFVYDVGAVTEAGVRRLLARVGPENMEDLLALRIADRLGSGVPKAQPYRLRHFQYMVEKVQHDPISVKMLKINGNDIMEVLKIRPGPKIGAILDVLLSEVIEEPPKNSNKYLKRRVKELGKTDLTKLRQMAKEKIEEKKEEEDQEIKGKYWVK